MFLALLGWASSMSAGNIVEELQDRLSTLPDRQQIVLTYTFEGCYGPYHHGEIEFWRTGDTIKYIHSSFDDQGKQPFNQAGKYGRADLLHLLAEKKTELASTIYGNKINYRLADASGDGVEGADRIEQRKFIALFQPLLHVFGTEDKMPIPKLRTGGFVH